MGIMIKCASLNDVIVIDGDSVTYAEGGTILEVLDRKEDLIAAFRDWQYAILQDGDSDEDLEEDDEDDDLEDLDLEEGDEEDDLEDLEEVAVVGPESLDEEEAVQRAREVMAKAIAEHQGLVVTPPLTLEQFDENAANSQSQP